MNRLNAVILLAACLLTASAQAGEWTSWRGPSQNGVSTDTGLVSSWTVDGENMIWKAPIIARSTPIVFDGRACVNGRVGEGIERQERVACFDAMTGKLLWDDTFNVYNTTVPFNRVGWASLVGDPETGYIYAHGVAGQLNAYDRKGKLVWSHFLGESQGRASGYGGRTQTPLVEGDQLILSAVFVGWGKKAAPRHRVYSFDKRTGEINWVSTPGGRVYDMNTQSAPIVATIQGQRLIIQGHADGHIHAIQASTGEPVWKFELSKRGINSTILLDGETVYASHSEENIDDPTMGRLVAIDATGKGNVTTTHEKWRMNEVAIGFPSPAFADGVLYAIDNSANLLAIDAESGTQKWSYSVGTVGKASPTIADGKIYVTETNGRIHILELQEDGTVKELDHDEVNVEGIHQEHEEGGADRARYSEIYGSPAVAYGRVYIATEGWLYAIGDASKKVKLADHKSPKAAKPAKGSGEAVKLVVSPTDFLLSPGETKSLRVRAYDAMGRLLGERTAEWSVEGLEASVNASGKLTASDANVASAGSITAKVGGLSASAVARIVPPLPWEIDFEDAAIDSVPVTWLAAPGKYKVEEKDGNKVLTKFVRPKGLLRNAFYMGHSDLTNYTIEADLMGNNKKRRKADIGLIAGGYTLDLQGSKQRLQIRSWASEDRMAQAVDFPWEMNVWYRAKLRVENDGSKGRVLGKVWKKGEPEPAEWTITVDDPLPIAGGSPGLQGYSPADIWFDNIKVTEN